MAQECRGPNEVSGTRQIKRRKNVALSQSVHDQSFP
jgi:hypothetical protein